MDVKNKTNMIVDGLKGAISLEGAGVDEYRLPFIFFNGQLEQELVVKELEIMGVHLVREGTVDEEDRGSYTVYFFSVDDPTALFQGPKTGLPEMATQVRALIERMHENLANLGAMGAMTSDEWELVNKFFAELA